MVDQDVVRLCSRKVGLRKVGTVEIDRWAALATKLQSGEIALIKHTSLAWLKKRFGKLNRLAVIRNNYAFHHPEIDEVEAAFEKAASEEGSEDEDWAVYFNKALLNTFFFVSDVVLVHGMADALAEADVNEAHKRLLGEMAPVANDLSEFTFGFAAAIFKRYVGNDLTMILVAKINDAPDIRLQVEANRSFVAVDALKISTEWFGARGDRLA
jgi:hypothetical protein